MDFEKTSWRLIKHPPAKGAWNMAIDEAILEAVYSGDSPATLRLYAWEPACLSLGYAQPFAEVDTGALAANGWEVVRRPTGGRAILHTDELTYAVIAPEKEPRVAGGVLESYLRLSRALLAALNLLGLAAEAKERQKSNQRKTPNPVCFEVPSNYEITINGKKLIGSAQARRKEGVLQHGSLPLHGDLSRIITALKFPTEAARQDARIRLQERATTVERAMGFAPDWKTASDAFVKSFSQTLNLNLVSGQLSEKEIQRAKDLMQEKYAHRSWTKRH
jgi:lipoyl(octanoyl) transferase